MLGGSGEKIERVCNEQREQKGVFCLGGTVAARPFEILAGERRYILFAYYWGCVRFFSAFMDAFPATPLEFPSLGREADPQMPLPVGVRCPENTIWGTQEDVCHQLMRIRWTGITIVVCMYTLGLFPPPHPNRQFHLFTRIFIFSSTNQTGGGIACAAGMLRITSSSIKVSSYHGFCICCRLLCMLQKSGQWLVFLAELPRAWKIEMEPFSFAITTIPKGECEPFDAIEELLGGVVDRYVGSVRRWRVVGTGLNPWFSHQPIQLSIERGKNLRSATPLFYGEKNSFRTRLSPCGGDQGRWYALGASQQRLDPKPGCTHMEH